jgi:hypothetical protein
MSFLSPAIFRRQHMETGSDFPTFQSHKSQSNEKRIDFSVLIKVSAISLDCKKGGRPGFVLYS